MVGVPKMWAPGDNQPSVSYHWLMLVFFVVFYREENVFRFRIFCLLIVDKGKG